MAGIYIHIPFCKKACHYCNFHFSTSTALQNDFVEALLKEIKLQKDYLQEEVKTVYFGGGTPSILSTEDIRRILQEINLQFHISNNSEITLEANPDDITAEKLREWKAIGINRLSIGIQSFLQDDLMWMNRAHNAEQAATCISSAQSEGFDNITIDLIYGTPTLSDDQWKQNVKKAIDLGVSHLSCYALTVEPKTALNKLIKQKKLADIDQEKQAGHFELLMDWMHEAGYEHYEISNFAKPGHRSKHNSSYWQGEQYLGLGPSAHSFNGISRQWNISNNAMYIRSLHNNLVPFEKEELSKDQQLNEYIMTSLRTLEGMSLQKVEKQFGAEMLKAVLTSAEPHIRSSNLFVDKDALVTTKKGKLLADRIAAELFI